MTPGALDALRSLRPSAARGLEASGRHGFKRQSEVMLFAKPISEFITNSVIALATASTDRL